MPGHDDPIMGRVARLGWLRKVSGASEYAAVTRAMLPGIQLLRVVGVLRGSRQRERRILPLPRLEPGGDVLVAVPEWFPRR
jgi:hypothetical protein